MTLRPSTWISASVLDAYIDYLSAEYPSNVQLIRISDIQDMSNNPQKLKKFATQWKSNDCYLVFLINKNEDHYITIEMTIDEKFNVDVDSLDLFIADSLANSPL